MDQPINLQESLLLRERQLFLSDIKDVFDDAVHNTAERGVCGPGTGASFVQHKVVRALKERMKLVSFELATMELGEGALFKIQQLLFNQYNTLLLDIMSVPSAWGKEGSQEQANHKKSWEEREKPVLGNYFESELKVSLKKRSLARRFDFKTTFLWIVVGALIGNIGKFFDLLSQLATRFLK